MLSTGDQSYKILTIRAELNHSNIQMESVESPHFISFTTSNHLHHQSSSENFKWSHQSHLMCRLLSEKKLYCHCIVTSALLRYHVLGVWGPCLYRDWLFWPSGQLDLFLCVTISTDPCDCVSVLLNKTDWCCSIKICVPSSRRDEI